MYFACPQPELLGAVLKVHRTVAAHSTIPALTGILIQAEEGYITLQGTDLDIGIIYSFKAEVLEAGEVLLPARIFTELVRKLPSTNITIQSLQNNMVEIDYSNSKIRLNSFDPNQYPLIPAIEDSYDYSVNIETFKNAIRKVSIATSNEDIQSVFNAVLLEINAEKNIFNMVATDTHRLAFYTNNTDEIKDDSFKIALVSNKAMNELSRLLPAEGEKLKLRIGFNQIFAEHENFIMYARLLNGKFPHYRQVIPKEYITLVNTNKKELLETVERATLLARDEIKSRSHVIVLQVESHLRITSESPEVGNLEENLPAQVEGNPLKLALNGRYLLDALRVIDTEEILLEMQTPLKPVVVRPVGENNYFCLILPVRIAE